MKAPAISTLLLAFTFTLGVTATYTEAHDDNQAAASYDTQAGAFHVHLIPLKRTFEVHVHSVAKHESVDLSKARTKATLLAEGKTTVIPLTVNGKGILTSARPLPRQWTLLIAFNLPGQPSAQARFTSAKAAKHAH